MDDKVKELVERVAEQCRGIACFLESLEWADLHEDEREMFRDYAKQILSHPNLYYWDLDVEVNGLDELYKAFISIALEVKDE